jgi:hypothetical protein
LAEAIRFANLPFVSTPDEPKMHIDRAIAVNATIAALRALKAYGRI